MKNIMLAVLVLTSSCVCKAPTGWTAAEIDREVQACVADLKIGTTTNEKFVICKCGVQQLVNRWSYYEFAYSRREIVSSATFDEKFRECVETDLPRADSEESA